MCLNHKDELCAGEVCEVKKPFFSYVFFWKYSNYMQKKPVKLNKKT